MSGVYKTTEGMDKGMLTLVLCHECLKKDISISCQTNKQQLKKYIYWVVLHYPYYN